MVEQQNWVYIQAREKPILDMFTDIWKDMQGKVYQQHKEAEESTASLAPNATLLYRQAEDSARLYTAIPSSSTKGLVFLRQKPELEYIINLFLPSNTGWHGTCTCGKFQNDRMPCAHALALIHELRLAPLQFIDQFHTRHALLSSYSKPLPPLLRSDLELDTSIVPPAVKRRRGRPQKKRREQGAMPSQGAPASSSDLSAVQFIAEPLASASSDAAAGEAKKRQRFNPWVYIPDIPQVEQVVTSRTRSGAL
jgi:hypothetical protein